MRILLVGLIVGLIGCGEKAVEQEKTMAAAPKPPRITHFYGNQAEVPKGGSLTLCYGTENVETVELEPSDDKDLRPSLNRCVGHSPVKDTTYTLKAKGPGGETSSSFSVRVGPPSAPQATGGKEREMIQSFVIVGRSPSAAGAPVQLCYSTADAKSVSVQPGAGVALAPGKNQCFVVKPQKTTTYVLTATAADGAVDRMQVPVPVQ